MQQTPFAELTLDHITNGMQTFLNHNLTKHQCQSLCYFGPLSSVLTADLLDQLSDKRKPLLPMGPLPLGAKPLWHSSMPCAAPPADPDLFELDLSDNSPDGTIQAYLYWCDLIPDHQPLTTLMF